MIELPYSDTGLIIRTDFSENSKWDLICKEINSPDNEFETLALFINDPIFSNLDICQLPKFDHKESIHSFVLLADSLSSQHPEHILLCIDLYDNYGDSLRIIPSQVCGIAACLSIANMDFIDFKRHLDTDGVFRGFPKIT